MSIRRWHGLTTPATAVDAGDYLEPYVEPVLPATLAADGTDRFQQSRAVYSPGSIAARQFGAGDFLSSIAGRRRRHRRRHARGLLSRSTNGTPLVELGVGIVVEVAAGTSKVVIERAIEAIQRRLLRCAPDAVAEIG